MGHKFTLRETVLILICAVLALGIFYYEFAYRRLESNIDSYNTADLTDELTVTEAKATKYQQMKKAIANSANDTSEVAVYDNLANEVSELGSILGSSARNINITWNDPTVSGTTVRRSADISFDTTGYTAARSLIENIVECRYRNVVTDLDIAGNNDASLENTDDVTVSLTVTFFETTDGATSTKGLVKADDDTSSDSSADSGDSSTGSSTGNGQ